MFLMGAIRPITITEQRKAVSTTRGTEGGSEGGTDGDDGVRLQPGQQLIRTVKADNFMMRTVVVAEKNCVLKSEQVSWYDPVSGDDRGTSKNEIFLTGADDI